MPRSVVIGANGFLGSHLVDTLRKAGHSVVAFDRFSRGSRMYTSPNVEEVQGDFLNRTDLRNVVEGADNVFHFLSATTPATSQFDPTLDVRLNVEPTIELLKACVDASVKKFYFASTGGAIYGDSSQHFLSEEAITAPYSPYGIGKLAVEGYLRYFNKVFGLSSIALRISNPYGPRQKKSAKQGLIPIALRQIAEQKPVTVFGDGSMVRDFIFVDDLMHQVELVVSKEVNGPIINLGSGKAVTVNEVLDSIKEATGLDFDVMHVPKPPTFAQTSVMDISLLTKSIGSTPFVSLADGIARTWEWTTSS